MEVLDGNGDLITWLSDDPDDWKLWNRYISPMVDS